MQPDDPADDSGSRSRRRIPKGILLDAALLTVAAGVGRVAERSRGLVHAGSDLTDYFIPNFVWWWQRPRWFGGWNPWVFGGYPANADPQIAPLHPLGLLYATLDPLTASSIDAFLTCAVGGVGMLLYLRIIGCERPAALVGALSFELGGYLLGHSPHPGILRAAIAVPWALVAIEALSGCWLTFCLTFAATAILVSGHPQAIIYALLVVAAYATILGHLRSRKRRTAIAAAGFLSLALSAPTWLPAMELVARSTRATGTSAIHLSETLSLKTSLRFVAPFAWGGSTGPLYGSTAERRMGCSVVECSSYVGMLPLLAVLGGVLVLGGDRRGRFWLGLATCGVVFAFGAAGTAAPGARAPVRFLIWWALSAPVCAALVLDRWRREPGSQRRLDVALPGLALALVLLWMGWIGPGAAAARVGTITAGVLVGSIAALLYLRHSGTTAAAWIVVSLVLFDLAAVAASWQGGQVRREFEEERAMEGLPGALRVDAPFARSIALPFWKGANWAPFQHLQLVQGYNPLVPVVLPSLLAQNPTQAEIGLVGAAVLAPENRVLDLLRVHTIVAPRWAMPFMESALSESALGATHLSPMSIDPSLDASLVAFENRRALPVAWIVRSIRVVPEEEALRLVHGVAEGSPFDPRREALASSALLGPPDPRWPANGTDSVQVIRFDEDEVELLVETFAPGLLVTSEPFSPGWQAMVEGRTAQIHSVNAGFRAVPVSAGRHRVVFRYRPLTSGVGVGAAAVALVILLGIGWAGAKGSARSRRRLRARRHTRSSRRSATPPGRGDGERSSGR